MCFCLELPVADLDVVTTWQSSRIILNFYSPWWFPHVSLLQVSSCSSCSSRSCDSTCKSTLLWQERKYHTPPATWTLRTVRKMNRTLIRSIVLVPSSFSLEAAENKHSREDACSNGRFQVTVNHALLFWLYICLPEILSLQKYCLKSKSPITLPFVHFTIIQADAWDYVNFWETPRWTPHL